ncbi:MAG: OmpA family protein [Fluviicola sp.]|nr:OmpA family protein [Fluviicola sp.]
MFRILCVVFLLFRFSEATAQSNFDGTWQGVVVRAGQKVENGTLLYFDITQSDNTFDGYSREEVYDSENFAVKKMSGKISGNTLTFKQIVVSKSKQSGRMKWCRFAGELIYDSITGYLKGNFKSSDCKRVIGKIILYKSNFEFSKEKESKISQHWFSQFIIDQHEGLNAPAIRKIERDNFIFEPVFFDFDESDIRLEHEVFLNRLIKVVKGHTDLRVKVTGHTDADGSNNYNDGLSQRRAQAIIDYFVAHGLKADRLVFDFKGENMPVDSNETKEGKQRNRRVDFRFI